MTVVDPSARAAQLSAERMPFVYATVVRALAPTSARPGDTALIHPDGRVEGFVGGLCAESSVRLYALQALAAGQPLLLRILPEALPQPSAGDIARAAGTVTVGNPCLSGGAIEVFLEPHRPPPRLLVVGDTPTARAMADLGRPLGFLVEVAGGDVSPPSADDAGLVVASHGRDETAALEAALTAGVPYVALVASRRRGAEVLAGLDVDDERRAQVQTPAGLWIGARTAAEVALSILAELVSLRSNADGSGQGRPDARSEPPLVEAATPPERRAARQTATAIDPRCGMTVAAVPGSLHVLGPNGQRTYFCGEGCRAAYLASLPGPQ